MPSWEGIEDATTMLPRIWLTRAKDGDVWKPLRKIDCKALNESRGTYNNICVAIMLKYGMHELYLYQLVHIILYFY